MKTIVLSTLLTLASVPSFATPEQMVFDDSWGVAKTPAQVQAELQAARANGEVFSGGEADVGSSSAPAGAALTRAEVRAGLVGYVAPNGEAGDAAPGVSAQPTQRVAQRSANGLH